MNYLNYSNYSSYPEEPDSNKVFKQTFDIVLNEQTLGVNSIDANMASINLNTSIDNKFINVMKFLNKIKGVEKGLSIRVTELKSYDVKPFNGELIQSVSLINNTYDDIKSYLQDKNVDILELRDEPPTATNYASYEKIVLAMLEELSPIKCSLKTNTFLREVIDNYTKYSIKSLGFDQYGICKNKSPKLTDLYNYVIDTEVMRKISNNRLVITETSAICSNVVGITNTFLSTLWLLDFLFQVSFGNISKACVTLTSSFDSNIYAILAFSYATRNSAVFYDYYMKSNNISKNISNISPNVSVYITKNVREYFVTVIYKNSISEKIKRDFNKPQLNNIKISLTLKGVQTTGYISRLLCNQTELGVRGITFGEYTFDGSQDGNPIHVGRNHSEELLKGPTVESVNSVFTFIIEESSAVILRVPIVASGGNSFLPGNTVVTVTPNATNSSPTTMSLKNFKNNYLS